MKKSLLLLLICLAINTLQSQITYKDAFPNLTFNFPIEIQNTGVQGDNRLFVVEHPGRIRVFQNQSTTTNSSLFLDISNKVNYGSGQEKGLLGLAFHPNYRQNGYFYVFYTGFSNNAIEMIVERYSVSANNPNSANANSACSVLSFVKNQNNSNHNGGHIVFGPDGMLYVSVGDGGGGGDPNRNAQNNNNLFGTVLRINVNAPCPGYSIPSDNPLVGLNGKDEIYAWGFRNTWKMSFDNQTNTLWGGDVGQSSREEINHIQKGKNYGWSRYEGNNIYQNFIPEPNNLVFPVYNYSPNQGDRSITGGYVYRGAAISNSNFSGKYIFGDYISGRVWTLDYNAQTGGTNRDLLFLAKTSGGSGVAISTFGKDIFNELYFADYGSSGKIYKIVDGTTTANPTEAVDGVGAFCEADLSTNGAVNAVHSDGQGKLYVGGDFSNLQGMSANNIAMWDGSKWSNLGQGINGEIKAITTTANGDLYVGGTFTRIGGINANHIARWNGSQWQALNGGTDGAIFALGTDANNQVYAGGTFNRVDGQVANNIARWNGRWNTLQDQSTGVAGTNNEIRSIAFDGDNTLYIGGNFDNAGGQSALRIATWKNNTWGTLGAGTSGFVQAIAISGDFVYIGGNFSVAGGTTVNRIARWRKSNSQWEKIENGLSGNVNSLQLKDGYLYVAGSFSTALNSGSQANIFVNSLARWKSNIGWQAIGRRKNVGVDNLLNALAFDGNQLFIGGIFNKAGQENYRNLAAWNADGYCAPCSYQGGDDDGDGICNNVDNCPSTNNPNQADQNGNGIGDACETPANTGDCENVSITANKDAIIVRGLNSPIEIVKVFNSNWQPLYNCSGDCNTTETFRGLSAGLYYVIVDLFTASWNPICTIDKNITIGENNTNPCSGQGGDSDSDGICDNQDNCIFNANPNQADNDNDGIGNACDATPNGNGGNNSGDCRTINITGENGKFTITDIPANTKLEYLDIGNGYGLTLICEGNCGSTKTVTGLIAGEYTIKAQTVNPYCYQEYKVTVGDNGNGGNPNNGGEDCQVTIDNCNIVLNNLPQNEISKVFNADFELIWECNPFLNKPCNHTEKIQNLNPATYYVEICGVVKEYAVNGCNGNNPTTGVTVFQHCNYDGQSATFAIGTYDFSTFIAQFPNNELSSVRVPEGYRVTLYRDNLNANNALVLTRDDNCLVNNQFNDLTSSVKVEFIGASSRVVSLAEVKLLEAQKRFGKKTDLKWYIYQVANKPVASYVVQRTTALNQPFKDIATISPSTEEGITTYTYTDNQPESGNNYYQIKIIYANEDLAKTSLQVVNFFEKKTIITIAPNPASDELRADVSAFKGVPIKCYINRINGEPFQTKTLQATHNDIISIPLDNFQNGSYIISFQPEGYRIESHRFVVLKAY